MCLLSDCFCISGKLISTYAAVNYEVVRAFFFTGRIVNVFFNCISRSVLACCFDYLRCSGNLSAALFAVNNALIRAVLYAGCGLNVLLNGSLGCMVCQSNGLVFCCGTTIYSTLIVHITLFGAGRVGFCTFIPFMINEILEIAFFGVSAFIFTIVLGVALFYAGRIDAFTRYCELMVDNVNICALFEFVALLTGLIAGVALFCASWSFFTSDVPIVLCAFILGNSFGVLSSALCTSKGLKTVFLVGRLGINYALVKGTRLCILTTIFRAGCGVSFSICAIVNGLAVIMAGCFNLFTGN